MSNRSPESGNLPGPPAKIAPAARRFPPRPPRPVGSPIPPPAADTPIPPPLAVGNPIPPPLVVDNPILPASGPPLVGFLPFSTSRSIQVPSFPGPPRSPRSSSPLVDLPPVRFLRPSISSPAVGLEYENQILREQLSASQEDLRLARDQNVRERSRLDRMIAMYRHAISRMGGNDDSGGAGPSG
jgi:hypothetical protein